VLQDLRLQLLDVPRGKLSQHIDRFLIQVLFWLRSVWIPGSVIAFCQLLTRLLYTHSFRVEVGEVTIRCKMLESLTHTGFTSHVS
jgi:hypothetical protein